MAAPSVAKILKSAEHTCNETGAKLTEKRRNVLATLLNGKRAMSPYEIADLYRENFGDTIPVMSVYRMLDFLAEEDLAHKLSTINKYIACAHIACEHSHEIPQFMICDTCETVSEIGINKSIISSIKANLKKAHFTLGSSQLELHGMCQSCDKS